MNKSLIIVTPVLNDWESFQFLVNELSKKNNTSNYNIKKIIAVNDGSNDVFPKDSFTSKIPVTIINLSSNMGHQRAISIGLSYVENTIDSFDAVVVMDSDGEDRPLDIEKLIQELNYSNLKKIVFAKREKRSEGFLFKVFYKLYKWMFYTLTKHTIDFGNFSCIPSQLLSRIVSIPEIWNHYSGGVIKSRIPYNSIGTDRGKRYHGSSKMNFQNLVLHGFSSISIYLDIVSVRLLFLAFFFALLTILGLGVVFYIGFFTDIAIPGWLSIVALSLINILAIVILTTFLILLFQLNQKNNVKFPPKKFYKDFILNITQL